MILRLGGICVLAAGQAGAENFETHLSPSPLTDGTRINITGEGKALVQWDGNILSVSGDFQGLATNATTAALYDGLGIGIPGPKVFDVSVTSGTSGTIWGSLQLTRKQVAELPSHQRAGSCRQLCRGRQAIYRGGNRPRRRQPRRQTHHPDARNPSSQQRQRDLCLRAAG
jgi:hypothetical protein